MSKTQSDPAAAEAAYLGALRADLLDAGFDSDQAFALCQGAAHRLFERGEIKISRVVIENA